MKAIPLFCSVVVVWFAGGDIRAADKAPPQAVRVLGPEVLQKNTRNLVYVEGLYEGKNWKPLPPDQFTVKVAGAGHPVDDPAGKPMNPFEISADDVARGQLTIEVRAGDKVATRTFAVGTAKPAGLFEAKVNPAVVSHRFAGFGGGVLFYDNQFDITMGDDLYDWCFRDVRTSFLHVLIRPAYEKDGAAAADWRSVDLDKYDFRSLERPFRIVKQALKRNPDLKIYASLYSPPARLKTNNSTGGQGSLKEGIRARQELARYVFAYLKYARQQEIPVHYLGLFNEPDFPHTQDGMLIDDLGTLVDTFHETTRALDTLIAADADMKKQAPTYVFPDTLGAGSITRAKDTRKLRERVARLERVGVWGVHDYWNQAGNYWNDRFRELRAIPGVGAKPVWMTEWAQTERHGDLASGVEFGGNMLNALRLGAEAWMVFEWCHPSGNQSGLISTDWGAKQPRARYWRSQAYHVFRQIANTTPPNAKVVSMTARWNGPTQAKGKGIEYLAVRDADGVVVHVMNTEPFPVNYRVTIAGASDKVEGWTTTPSTDMTALDAKDFKVARPASSTVLSGVVAGNSLLSFAVKTNK
jgi:hypothetical protein